MAVEGETYHLPPLDFEALRERSPRSVVPFHCTPDRPPDHQIARYQTLPWPVRRHCGCDDNCSCSLIETNCDRMDSACSQGKNNDTAMHCALARKRRLTLTRDDSSGSFQPGTIAHVCRLTSFHPASACHLRPCSNTTLHNDDNTP